MCKLSIQESTLGWNINYLFEYFNITEFFLTILPPIHFYRRNLFAKLSQAKKDGEPRNQANHQEIVTTLA